MEKDDFFCNLLEELKFTYILMNEIDMAALQYPADQIPAGAIGREKTRDSICRFPCPIYFKQL